MLIDDIFLSLKAGNGGNGNFGFISINNSFKKIPCGGNGGKGGDIILIAKDKIKDFNHLLIWNNKKNSLNRRIEGENGFNGGRFKKRGKNGKNVIIEVPLKSSIFKIKNGKKQEKVCSLNTQNQKIVLLKGGKGGNGNFNQKGNWIRKRKKLLYKNKKFSKKYKGEQGQLGNFKIEFKIQSDVSLIGFPNSGKTSVIHSLTGYLNKIKNYPFTTLNPILSSFSIIRKNKTKTIIRMLDTPAINYSSFKGKNLGFSFLKHVLNSSLILFIIDGKEIEDNVPLFVKNMSMFLNCLKLSPFSNILNVQKFIIINKFDLLNKSKTKKISKVILHCWNKFIKNHKLRSKEIFYISCINKYGINLIKTKIIKSFF
jgi:GTP-binding protein